MKPETPSPVPVAELRAMLAECAPTIDGDQCCVKCHVTMRGIDDTAEWPTHHGLCHACGAAALDDLLGALPALLAAYEDRERMRADLVAAAGDLPVPIPEPGTDAARLLMANRLLKVEVDRLRSVIATNAAIARSSAGIEGLAMENERYRAALERIAALKTSAAHLARRALAGAT